MFMSRTKQYHRPSGASLLELPLCLWLLLIMFFVPLFDLAIIAMRVATVYNAAHNAAAAAARSETFTNAVQNAHITARNTFQNGFGGVNCSENKIHTRIICTSIDGYSESFTSSLPILKASLDKYVYEFETEVVADVFPPITMRRSLFGTVPCLI